MLAELSIREFAVVEAAALELGPGLNVLTGETGAGKSIVVDALNVALGARATTDVIRTGAHASRVTARFALAGGSLAALWLAERGLFDPADGPGGDARPSTAEVEAVVAREITLEGRSRAWINGRPATVAMLRELGDLMVEVAGQHEGQTLLRPAAHLGLLDAFGGEEQIALRGRVAEMVGRRSALLAERRALADGERERLRECEILRHQVAEIDAARLRPGEEEELQLCRSRLANAERLAGAASAAYAALYEAEGTSAVERLGQARTALREASAMDPSLGELGGRVDLIAGDLVEAAHDLARYAASVEAKPDELDAVEERLAVLRALKRKYGETADEIAAYGRQASGRLARLEASDERAAEVDAAVGALEGELGGRCSRLSELRAGAASRLERALEETLAGLEMGRTRFVVRMERVPDPEGVAVGGEKVALGPWGVDRAEFLISPNPGEEPKPLARIASGGELSRVMLALRHVLAEAGGVPVMVCDEVDAGVGSRTAGAVGRLLAEVGRARQVLCVTHLPQVASMADRHYWIVKETSGERTRVRALLLGPDQRVEEIARMLGGRRPTQVALEHATEMLGRSGRGRAARGASRGGKGGVR